MNSVNTFCTVENANAMQRVSQLWASTSCQNAEPLLLQGLNCSRFEALLCLLLQCTFAMQIFAMQIFATQIFAMQNAMQNAMQIFAMQNAMQIFAMKILQCKFLQCKFLQCKIAIFCNITKAMKIFIKPICKKLAAAIHNNIMQ